MQKRSLRVEQWSNIHKMIFFLITYLRTYVMFALNRFSISIYIDDVTFHQQQMESIFARLNYYLGLAKSLKCIHKRQRNVIPHASSFCLVNGKLLVALIYYNNCRTLDICCRFFVANFVGRNVKNVLVMLYVGKYNRVITQPE